MNTGANPGSPLKERQSMQSSKRSADSPGEGMLQSKRTRLSDGTESGHDDDEDLKVKSSIVSKEKTVGDLKSEKTTADATSSRDATSSNPDSEAPAEAGGGGEPDKFAQTFPERLMGLLDDENLRDVMWWLPDGDAFCLVPKTFSDKVLNSYFQGTKFESFTRKLNRWGFKRVAGQKVPPDTVAYHHEAFQRGKPELLREMSGGKKKEADFRDAILQQQLALDLQMAGKPILLGTNTYPSNVFSLSGLGGVSGGVSGLGGLGAAGLLGGVRGMIPPDLLGGSRRQLLGGSPTLVDQDLQLQALLMDQQASRQLAAASNRLLQRQAQQMLMTEQLLAAQQQQQQQQQHQQQLQSDLSTQELRLRLLQSQASPGGPLSPPSAVNSSDLTSRLLLAAQQQQLPLPPLSRGGGGGAAATATGSSRAAAAASAQQLLSDPGQIDPQLLQLYLLRRQQQQQQLRRNLG